MEEHLKKLGLDENEAKVYLALLELGPALASEISKKASINRTTSYDILERLAGHGLVAKASGAGIRKKYSAEPPSRLTTFLKNKQKIYAKRAELAESFIPDLNLIYKEKKKPTIKFFEDTEGLKAIYNETLKSKEEILSILDLEGWTEEDLAEWGREYNKKRARLKIPERLLVLKSPEGIKWMKNYPTTLKYTEYRWIPKEKFPFFYTEINIYEDKVVVALLKKPHRIGMMVQSESFANIQKAMWNLAWEGAEKYNPKKDKKPRP